MLFSQDQIPRPVWEPIRGGGFWGDSGKSRPLATCYHFRAEDGTRTRDPDLGKVVLYQLSHFRITARISRIKV